MQELKELKVVLKKSENLSFGFSLLGTAGLPHVIYDICENSPAAECGEVSEFHAVNDNIETPWVYLHYTDPQNHQFQ